MLRSLVFACCCSAGLVCAQTAQNSDMDALNLADQTPDAEQPTQKNWAAFGEAAQSRVGGRNGHGSHDERRLSLDVRMDKSLSDSWRVSFADRLDVNWLDEEPSRHSINTIKEAYLSWKSAGDHRIDVGRVNVYNGVSIGYNPTDFFKVGALRSVISSDPKQLTRDRQGTVMLRGQLFGERQALTAILAPKLKDGPASTPFNPNLGATNNVNRGLLSYSVKVSDEFNPQFLLYKEGGLPVQLGVNATALANDATVLFAQWVGGRSRSFYARALGLPGNAGFKDRASVGATYTTAMKLSLTAELDVSRGSLSRADWAQLGERDPQSYWLYRSWILQQQEMATRQALTLYANWRDAFVSRLDVAGLARVNLTDKSSFSWLEFRYHWDQVDLALLWQTTAGRALTEYGALPQSRATSLSLRSYF
jgi:hypothetical protein